MKHDLAARLLEFVRILTDEEISMSTEELLCFLTVATRPGLSVGELAAATRLPQSTVSRHIKRLSARPHRSAGALGPLQWELEIGSGEALLAQAVHPENVKQKALHITAQGQELLERFGRAIASR
ncbi:MarR family transcriptional regulator [Phenylobacterium sp. RIFCSPHIGHO2_01_FULL_69_31]|uniref:MarR family transcriptional regulator n=1 Tax=Phenylobacterium sp. RIFCSPHIGHO2_01_FULL_69_31 TaxID=1801944 RepID=UPI0025EB9E3C|nr:MarR family transcriptional regulator [Phenylobacterium sp. RIFCSPHIGHO2_01_FULL_69_31]